MTRYGYLVHDLDRVVGELKLSDRQDIVAVEYVILLLQKLLHAWAVAVNYWCKLSGACLICGECIWQVLMTCLGIMVIDF